MVHKPAPAGPVPFGELRPGSAFEPLELTISAAANERYWSAAGAEHALLRAGVLYPPIAANLTVLVFGTGCADPVIQTRQRLRCSGRMHSGDQLFVTGTVLDTYAKRGRAYVDFRAEVAHARRPDEAVWESTVAFTPAATLGAPR